MSRRRTLSDIGVAGLKPQPKRYAEPDPELRGHYVRVTPNGTKSFVVVAREPGGRQVWATIGSPDLMKIDTARDIARDAIRRIRDGLPAIESREETDTFDAVADAYLKRHVRARKLRSEAEITRVLDRYVRPRWRGRLFSDLRRRDVTDLLDQIEDDNGARQADCVLAVVRGIANWFAARNDDYVSPIVRGMRRSAPASRARARILEDDELRLVWKHSESAGVFGAIVQFALLTAQRREKVLTIKWSDLSDDGEWTIVSNEREKATAGSIVLPEAALAIIYAQPRLVGNPYVFAGRGTGHFNGLSKAKARFNAGLPDVEAWTIHDLRRTARSLMSRAGVRPDIAERVLGHAIPGVEGVYDRHAYNAEKADALVRLANMIAAILNPQEINVAEGAFASVAV